MGFGEQELIDPVMLENCKGYEILYKGAMARKGCHSLTDRRVSLVSSCEAAGDLGAIKGKRRWAGTMPL
jgi:hypothetical protein